MAKLSSRILSLRPVALILIFKFALLSAYESKVKLLFSLSWSGKINTGLFLNEAYKIQIFYGNSEESKKKLQEFKREFKDLDGTIIFNSPNYKVWIGNFKTRIEVERAMVDIKKKYPTALIIKPTI